MKIGIITSKGGHIFQLLQLENFYKNYERFWVVFKGEDVSYYLKNEKKYYANYPESRNILNAIKNFFLAIKILKSEQPKFLISSERQLPFLFL